MHEARLAEAQENVERLKEEVSVRIGQSYNRVERTKKMLEVAAEVVTLRTEGERIAENQLTQGVVLFSARRQAAASYKARAELLQAQLAHLLARAELEVTNRANSRAVTSYGTFVHRSVPPRGSLSESDEHIRSCVHSGAVDFWPC